MSQRPSAVGVHGAAYVLKEDAERLLNQAHERGRQLGFAQAQETIQDEIRRSGRV